MKKTLTVLILILSGLCTAVSREHPALRIRQTSVSHQNLIPGASYVWNGRKWSRQSQDHRHPRQNPLRVLGIMVQFQEDNDIMTTGNGRFMMNAPEEPVINAPPHDRRYFQNQLRALSHYYASVSDNRLSLETEVFQPVLTLSEKMGYYNPGTTEERTDIGLGELARDAVLAADSAGASFSDYDVFILFHAGAGRDIELGYDPSPKDIPSAFLNLNDLATALGEEYQDGIPVQQGQFHVKELLILPETQNQEGFEFGLLGTMTLMFGFQLGLPALWNTETGQSGVGRWGMMDQGSGNYSGMIPCEPCAFSKVFLGWETPIEVRNDSNLTVACSAARDSRKIYKVPINAQEYYLIENRRYDANFDSVTYGFDDTGNEIEFPSSGFLELEEPIGVIVSVDEYDYGLPGSGILIWHIDEAVVLENLEANKVNADPSHKGVDLEEADGAQDIGESYGFLSGGGGSEGGVLHDCWFEDNDVHKLANHSSTVAFTPDSYPNSASNSGARTHIRIDSFSEADTLMTFSVSTGLMQSGFPKRFPNHDEFLPPLVGDVDGDGDREILVAGSYDFVYAWNHDGSPLFESGTEGTYTTLSGEEVRYAVPLMPLDTYRNRKIDVLGDWDRDGLDELIVSGDKNGEIGIHIFRGTDNDGDGVADREGFIPFDIEDLPVHMALDTAGQTLAVISYQGVFRLFSSDLTLLASERLSSSNLTGLCQRAQSRGWAVTGQDERGMLFLLNHQGELEAQHETNGGGMPSACVIEGVGETLWFYDGNTTGFWNSVNQAVHTLDCPPKTSTLYLPMPAADIDRDGFPEVIQAAGTGRLYAFNDNGSRCVGFPVPGADRDTGVKQPLIADVNGDSRLELLLPTDEGNIEVYSDQGEVLTDLYLSTGCASRISIDDVDSDGDMEILAVASTGMLYVWDLDAPCNETSVPWGYDAHDPGRTGLCPQVFIPAVPVLSDWMPKRMAYNYPNPNEENFTMIRYRLEQAADVTITLYDLAGETVDTMTGPGFAQADHEVRWDLTDIASGVYICHIQANGNEGVKEVTFKIGVVK